MACLGGGISTQTGIHTMRRGSGFWQREALSRLQLLRLELCLGVRIAILMSVRRSQPITIGAWGAIH